MNSILVVGGAGQTGQVLCQLLSKSQITPIALDDLSTGQSDRVIHGPLVKVDVRQTPRVIRTIKEHGISILVHSALATTSENPLDVFEQNLTTTMSLLQSLQETKRKHLVVVNPPPLTEDMLARILSDCSNAYGYKATIAKGTPDEIAKQILALN